MRTKLTEHRLGREWEVKSLIALDLGMSESRRDLLTLDRNGNLELIEDVDRHFSNVYRVQVKSRTEVHVIKLGVGVDEDVEGIYSSVDALPNWIKERLAVLMVIDPKQKPTQDIENVGKRISESVFWVCYPADSSD